MTASPSAAQPVAGSHPLPEADQLPPDGVAPTDAEEAPPEERRRRKLLLLLLLLGAFIVLLGLAIWYLLFRQPIPIPSIPGETVMPGYVTSIYGAARPMSVAVTGAGDRVYIGETSGEQPPVRHHIAQPQRPSRIDARQVLDRGVQVRGFGDEGVARLDLAPERRCGTFREREHCGRVPGKRRIELTGLDEALECVLTDGLEHAESRRSTIGDQQQ